MSIDGVTVRAAAAAVLIWLVVPAAPAFARGFGGAGGFHAGGFSAGGFGGAGGDAFHAGGFNAGGFGGFDGARAGGVTNFNLGGISGYGERSDAGISRPWGGGAVGGSYSHDISGANGGSIDTSGTRGAAWGPGGGFAAGGDRDTTVTGPNGETYNGSRDWGAAGGPFGGFAAGGSSTGSAMGPAGSFDRSGSWGAAGYRSPFGGGYADFGHEGAFSGSTAAGAFAGSTGFAGAGFRFPTDAGLARYSPYGVAGARYTTYRWSDSAVAARAGYVRAGFVGYGAFYPSWYAAHPGVWAPAAWAAGAAWTPATWAALSTLCGVQGAPIDYDYGDTVVYQNDQVSVNGGDPVPAEQYSQQAADLANQGQQAQASPEQQWTPIGVFAMVQGTDTSSNLVLQLAVDQAGVIRGNYYDAVMNSTSPVAGQIDPKSQRAAWVVGNGKFPVFEAGVYNLTQEQSPVLVHFAADKAQQWLMVRMKQPPGGPNQAPGDGAAGANGAPGSGS